ncbi:MAG: HEAT repeat domain-containing protein [Kofleriaceae bacterium]
MSARFGLVVIVGAPVIAIGIASYVVLRYDPAVTAASVTTAVTTPVPDPPRSAVERRLREAIASNMLHEQAAAVDALAYLTAPKTAELLYLALEASPAIRIKAANALGEMHLREAVPRLRVALARTKEPEEEIQIAAALYRLGDAEARVALNTATVHKNTQIFAAVALAENGDELGRKILLQVLETTPKGRDYWRMAIGGLARLGDERALAILEAELGGRDPQRSLEAAKTLARAGNPKGVDQLVKFVTDHELDHPSEAALALARLGDRRALDWVPTGFASPDADERKAAIAVCTTLGAREHAAAIDKLARTDPDSEVRTIADVASLAF